MKKIRKGDEVIVTTGKDKGRRGTVSKVQGEQVFVAGVNMVKRHTKPNPQRGVAGGIVDKEAALHLSNIAIFNPASKKGEKVGIRVLEDGRKVRFFKSNNELVDA